MSRAATRGPAATAPQERGWLGFVLALAAVAAVSVAPVWPAPLALAAGAVRLLLPVEQLGVLVVASVAALAVVGWRSGGRWTTAMVWVAAATYVLQPVSTTVDGYGAFVGGWTVLLAASFGVVCLATPGRPLLGRALAAVALAAAMAVVGLRARQGEGTSAFRVSGRMLGEEYQRRLEGTMTQWDRRAQSAGWRAFATRFPDAAAGAGRVATVLRTAAAGAGGAPPLVELAPALLALESLLALALGWAAYHRMARVRVGPPLGPLPMLRFNDQLVWGAVTGATLSLLPTLAEWRLVGLNLVGVFGTLYALRGAAVLSWYLPDGLALPALLALLVVVWVVGPGWGLAAVAVGAVGLGLGDTWRDFRAGAPRRSLTS